jgi:hypothetical protein
MMKYETRVTMTMALLILLAGACSAAQQKAVHDTLDGVHAICEGSDQVHLLLDRVTVDGGSNDSPSGTVGQPSIDR